MPSTVRTLEQFSDHLDEDLVWRKRELVTWATLLANARVHEKPVLLRGAWALLYAHYEGYIKESCTAYLEHLSLKGLKISDLREELVAVALRASILLSAEAKQGSIHTRLVAMIRTGAQPAHLPYDSATIKTFSNLKFEVFEEVLLSVGCDPSPHLSAKDDIDKRLLKHRNDIAHGRAAIIDIDDWEELRMKIVPILDNVHMQLSNAASQKLYLR